jgi:predicted NBD/HSP70 family sugar kinase
MGRSKKTVLEIDIGGSRIRAALGRRHLEFKTPRRKTDFVRILKDLPASDTVKLAVAGVVAGSKVLLSPNIKYLKNFDFKKIFPEVYVDNDARAYLEKRLSKFRSNRILAFTIGTGIGRAYAERGKVKKIKKFEYPERWEKEYQKIRDKKNYERLAEFLGAKFNVLIRRYRPEAVLLGGGVLNKEGFYRLLRKKLSKNIYVQISK